MRPVIHILAMILLLLAAATGLRAGGQLAARRLQTAPESHQEELGRRIVATLTVAATLVVLYWT